MTILNKRYTKLLCIASMGSAILLSGCSTSTSTSMHTSTWALGQPQCRVIGCGANLNFYPNADGEGQNQARRFHNFEWGQDNITPTNNPYVWNKPK